ncbi:MFS transporter [Scopulibacillus cellulosilyticus]|uniref:MFS transporter n=1 Tax=Scopulibacillus cellulosilyticus TaxID=2665665 RepID=A0ABW2PWN0_9BACL
MRNLRWFVMTVWFILGIVCYIDRMNIAVSSVPLMNDLHINATQFGYAVSAFTLGYFIFSIPTGVIMDKWGIKKTTILFTLGWGVFSILSGAVWALLPLIIFRFIFGMSETVLGPSLTGLNKNWMLPSERGRISGLFIASLMIGTVIGAPLNAAVVSVWNWRGAFYVTGIISFFVALLFYLFIKDRPNQHRWMTSKELDLINKEQQKDNELLESFSNNKPSSVSLAMIFKNKTIWLTGIGLFLINFLYWADLQWLPSYFSLVRHTSVMASGIYTALPFLAAAFGSYVSGELTDRIFKKMRIPVIVIGAVLAAPCAIWAMMSESITGSVTAFMLMAFFNGWAIAQTYTLPMEIFPDLKERAPTISAFYITCNSLAGILAPLVIGPIYDATKSFSAAFYIFGALNVIGGLLYLTAYKKEKKFKRTGHFINKGELTRDI